MKNRIMVDLETLGTAPGSVILSIGAVRFDVEEGLLDEFYVNIDVESSQRLGLTIDGATVMWWMKQSDAARAKLSEGSGEDVGVALGKFLAWANKDSPVDELWGNGADFDNVLLASVGRKLSEDPRYAGAWGSVRPSLYRQNRCYRTLKNLSKIPFTKPVVAHDALEDAKAQAVHLIEILKELHLG